MNSEIVMAVIAGVFVYIAAGVLVITSIALAVAVIVDLFKRFK